eukprot:CAMPEP_0119466896 /NCGR_PEP_ID=MMETSP1344-20130328/1337_1 /TAXON_ID=236787 /ORGANISM="Florenciella parvula, Strain CCMP2471" /LENGTH=666 /DNA_ID=CAMNT_0007499235 /DNA_START=13 /DNA_END=2010 /DNA_ORIENTATION=-
MEAPVYGSLAEPNVPTDATVVQDYRSEICSDATTSFTSSQSQQFRRLKRRAGIVMGAGLVAAVVVLALIGGEASGSVDTKTMDAAGPDASLSFSPVMDSTTSVFESSHNPKVGQSSTSTRSASTAASNTTQYHVVMITLDDVGMNDLGYMSTDLFFSTPTMDRMATKGMKITNYYGQSVCTPARTTIMSGKFVHRTGFQSVVAESEVNPTSNYSVSLQNKLLPQHLESLGYKSHILGKWNIGHCNDDYLPLNRGAHSFLGYMGPGMDYKSHLSSFGSGNRTQTFWSHGEEQTYNVYDMLEGGTHENGEKWWNTGSGYSGMYSTTIFANRASRIIRQFNSDTPTGESDRASPMFMWLAFHAAHDDHECNPTDGYSFDVDFGQYTNVSKLSDVRKTFGNVLMNVDHGVDEVMAAIDESGLWGSTVVIVQSDNGGWPCGDHTAGDNYPYRGSKMTYFEGGVKVPAFIYAPGILSSGEYVGLMHHVDWLATIVEGIAGGVVDDDTSDSLDHWAAIVAAQGKGSGLGDQYALRDKIVFTLDDSYAVVRHGDLKLMYQVYNSTWFNVNYDAKDHAYFDDDSSTSLAIFCQYDSDMDDDTGKHNFLFNISADPREKVNLYYHEEHEKSRDQLLSWARSTYDSEHYEPTYPFGEPSDNVSTTTMYYHGGYIVPW